MSITISTKHNPHPTAHNEYCGRGSVFGNPFQMKDKSDAERNRVCDEFIPYFKAEANVKDSPLNLGMRRLLGMHLTNQDINLMCFCFPKRCHCETIKKSLDDAKERIGNNYIQIKE